MTIRELREILEEYDGEMEIVISEYDCPNETYSIEKVSMNYKKDNPRLTLIPEL